jgi:aspartyl-tRNA(Asn)/glutamyl-tRNA(Gln) amidotransferase subunit B
MDDVEINPGHVIELLELLQQNKITPLKAKDILRKFIPKSFSPKEVAKEHVAITNEKHLEKIIDEILKKFEKSVKDYKSGETKALNFLIGKVMQTTNKRADFQAIKKILEKKLK